MSISGNIGFNLRPAYGYVKPMDSQLLLSYGNNAKWLQLLVVPVTKCEQVVREALSNNCVMRSAAVTGQCWEVVRDVPSNADHDGVSRRRNGKDFIGIDSTDAPRSTVDSAIGMLIASYPTL